MKFYHSLVFGLLLKGGGGGQFEGIGFINYKIWFDSFHLFIINEPLSVLHQKFEKVQQKRSHPLRRICLPAHSHRNSQSSRLPAHPQGRTSLHLNIFERQGDRNRLF